MSLILFIFRDLNSESSNMEMHYSHLYFKDENKELLEYGFCYKISIYKDRAKKRALLEMLLGFFYILEIKSYYYLQKCFCR